MIQIPISENARAISDRWQGFNAPAPVAASAECIFGDFTLTLTSPNPAVIPGMLIPAPGYLPTVTRISTVSGTDVEMTQAALAGTIAIFWFIPPNEAPINTPMIHLMKAMPAPGQDPSPSDFTEADFDGYAPLPASELLGPFVDTSGNGVLKAVFDWLLSLDPAVGNSIYGYWIDYNYQGTPEVALWEIFPQALPMTAAGNFIGLDVPLQQPPGGSASVTR
jgi:hypothetical protein